MSGERQTYEYESTQFPTSQDTSLSYPPYFANTSFALMSFAYLSEPHPERRLWNHIHPLLYRGLEEVHLKENIHQIIFWSWFTSFPWANSTSRTCLINMHLWMTGRTVGLA